jgi:synaptonemal complex protein ZIP1
MKSSHRIDDSFDTAAELSKQAGGSKAVAGAIRALHEKISRLEKENLRLEGNMTSIQQSSQSEIEKLTSFYKQEISSASDKERKLNIKISEQEDEITRNQARTVKLEEQIHMLEAQLQAADSFQRRAHSNSFYKESFSFQTESLDNSIKQKRMQEEELIRSIKLLEVNKKSLESSISLHRNQLRELQLEVERFKSTVNAEKAATIKAEYRSQIVTYIQDSTQIQAFNSLQELCNFQTAQISELQKKLTEAQSALKSSEEMREELEAEK